MPVPPSSYYVRSTLLARPACNLGCACMVFPVNSCTTAASCSCLCRRQQPIWHPASSEPLLRLCSQQCVLQCLLASLKSRPRV